MNILKHNATFKLFIWAVLFLFLAPAPSMADEKEYVSSLARQIVKGLEAKIRKDEVMVSLGLIKTKKEKKIIPLSRMLRKELARVLEGSPKVTLPPLPAMKTDYILTGFIRIKGSKVQVYAKVLDSKSGKKLAGYKIKSLDMTYPSLFEEQFDDYLQRLVEDAGFMLVEQNFFIEGPVFKGKPEPELGEYIRKSLSGMWADYVNVYEEKKPSVHWSVKTEVKRSGGMYHVKMTLFTHVGSKDYTVTSVSIPQRLSPVVVDGGVEKRFVIVARERNDDSPFADEATELHESLAVSLSEVLADERIAVVGDASVVEAASRWLVNKKSGGLAGRVEYIIESRFTVTVTRPTGDQVAGGVKGELRLTVFDASTGAKRVQIRLKKGGVFVEEGEIQREMEKIAGNIRGRLIRAVKEKFRGL